MSGDQEHSNDHDRSSHSQGGWGVAHHRVAGVQRAMPQLDILLRVRQAPRAIYTADAPPSIGMTTPVTWGDSSDARYKARQATSTGCANLFNGKPFM